MTDKYAHLRAALDAGPTPGPWAVRYDYVVQAPSFDDGRLVPVAQPYGVNSDGTDLFANARLIAAANPETIRALLADYDRMRQQLEWIERYARDSLTTDSRDVNDWYGDAECIASSARAALAQEQGES